MNRTWLTQSVINWWASVAGLIWISRSCRPGISYNTSRLQSAIKKATVEDILSANRTVEYVKETPNVSITEHVYRRSLRRVSWQRERVFGWLGMMSKHFGVKVPRSCLSATSVQWDRINAAFMLWSIQVLSKRGMKTESHPLVDVVAASHLLREELADFAFGDERGSLVTKCFGGWVATGVTSRCRSELLEPWTKDWDSSLGA